MKTMFGRVEEVMRVLSDSDVSGKDTFLRSLLQDSKDLGEMSRCGGSSAELELDPGLVKEGYSVVKVDERIMDATGNREMRRAMSTIAAILSGLRWSRDPSSER